MTKAGARKSRSKGGAGKTKAKRTQTGSAGGADGAGVPAPAVHSPRALRPGPRGGMLAPMWKPGESGNPKGRSINPGLMLVEAVAMMWPWPLFKIEKVARDKTVGSDQQIAAQMLVAMRDGQWDKVDRQPRSLQTLLAWMDRWMGKVPERIELAVAKVNVPGSIEELGELMATDESALAVLEQAVARAKQRLLNPPQTGGKPHTDDGTAA